MSGVAKLHNDFHMREKKFIPYERWSKHLFARRPKHHYERKLISAVSSTDRQFWFILLPTVSQLSTVMEAAKTNKGKPLLVFVGFRFRQDKINKCTMNWRCVRRDCKAKCKTALDNEFISVKNDHNHDEESSRSIEVHKLRQSCKGKATEDPFQRPSKVIALEIQKGVAQTEEMLPKDMKMIRRAVYRER